MKVILSRKGFDSAYGGIPSFILPDKTMLSLPIPNLNAGGTQRCFDNDKFSKVFLPNGMSASEAIKTFKPTRTRLCPELRESDLDSLRCHLDPDLYAGARANRRAEWRGCFGQEGAPLTHLQNCSVGKDDLFIFFGWFCETENYSKSRGKHALFGYLQIEKRYDLPNSVEQRKEIVPDWAEDHPHVASVRHGENNALFVARKNLSFLPELPGWGLFTYSSELDLTSPGMTRSRWKVIDAFKGSEPTHHSESSWKPNKNSPSYFQSAMIGQEFVFPDQDDGSGPVPLWAKSVIEAGMRDQRS